MLAGCCGQGTAAGLAACRRLVQMHAPCRTLASWNWPLVQSCHLAQDVALSMVGKYCSTLSAPQARDPSSATSLKLALSDHSHPEHPLTLSTSQDVAVVVVGRLPDTLRLPASYSLIAHAPPPFEIPPHNPLRLQALQDVAVSLMGTPCHIPERISPYTEAY